jgi:hypothetical protein
VRQRIFVAADAKNPEGAIKFLNYLQHDGTTRFAVEKFNTIPAHPVDMEGLDVPDLFKRVLDDLSESPQAGSFGYNIDVLAPQNFNDVMFSGFQGGHKRRQVTRGASRSVAGSMDRGEKGGRDARAGVGQLYEALLAPAAAFADERRGPMASLPGSTAAAPPPLPPRR